METRIVTVDLHSFSYDVYIGSGLLYRLADFIPSDVEGRAVFLVADTHMRDYTETMRGQIQQAGAKSVEIFYLKSGEKTKSFSQIEKVLDWMLDYNVARERRVNISSGSPILSKGLVFPPPTRRKISATGTLSHMETPIRRIAARVSSFTTAPPPVANTHAPPDKTSIIELCSAARNFSSPNSSFTNSS